MFKHCVREFLLYLCFNPPPPDNSCYIYVLTPSPPRLMGCTHSFHRYCIDKWLEEDQHCPVCKNDIIVMAQHMGVKVDREKYKKKYW